MQGKKDNETAKKNPLSILIALTEYYLLPN